MFILTRYHFSTDLIFNFSPRQLSNHKFHQHVKQGPEVIVTSHFLWKMENEFCYDGPAHCNNLPEFLDLDRKLCKKKKRKKIGKVPHKTQNINIKAIRKNNLNF